MRCPKATSAVRGSFFFSVEIFQPAQAAFNTAASGVQSYVTGAVATSSSLSAFDGELRYIPIVMPDGMKARYPARSRARIKQRLYDCAPQLTCEAFVAGTFDEQVREYIRGMGDEAERLIRVGASREQVGEFRMILAAAGDHVVRATPSASLH